MEEREKLQQEDPCIIYVISRSKGTSVENTRNGNSQDHVAEVQTLDASKLSSTEQHKDGSEYSRETTSRVEIDNIHIHNKKLSHEEGTELKGNEEDERQRVSDETTVNSPTVATRKVQKDGSHIDSDLYQKKFNNVKTKKHRLKATRRRRKTKISSSNNNKGSRQKPIRSESIPNKIHKRSRSEHKYIRGDEIKRPIVKSKSKEKTQPRKVHEYKELNQRIVQLHNSLRSLEKRKNREGNIEIDREYLSQLRCKGNDLLGELNTARHISQLSKDDNNGDNSVSKEEVDVQFKSIQRELLWMETKLQNVYDRLKLLDPEPKRKISTSKGTSLASRGDSLKDFSGVKKRTKKKKKKKNSKRNKGLREDTTKHASNLPLVNDISLSTDHKERGNNTSTATTTTTTTTKTTTPTSTLSSRNRGPSRANWRAKRRSMALVWSGRSKDSFLELVEAHNVPAYASRGSHAHSRGNSFGSVGDMPSADEVDRDNIAGEESTSGDSGSGKLSSWLEALSQAEDVQNMKGALSGFLGRGKRMGSARNSFTESPTLGRQGRVDVGSMGGRASNSSSPLLKRNDSSMTVTPPLRTSPHVSMGTGPSTSSSSSTGGSGGVPTLKSGTLPPSLPIFGLPLASLPIYSCNSTGDDSKYNGGNSDKHKTARKSKQSSRTKKKSDSTKKSDLTKSNVKSKYKYEGGLPQDGKNYLETKKKRKSKGKAHGKEEEEGEEEEEQKQEEVAAESSGSSSELCVSEGEGSEDLGSGNRGREKNSDLDNDELGKDAPAVPWVLDGVLRYLCIPSHAKTKHLFFRVVSEREVRALEYSLVGTRGDHKLMQAACKIAGPHPCASFVLSFLQQLPEPLFTNKRAVSCVRVEAAGRGGEIGSGEGGGGGLKGRGIGVHALTDDATILSMVHTLLCTLPLVNLAVMDRVAETLLAVSKATKSPHATLIALSETLGPLLVPNKSTLHPDKSAPDPKGGGLRVVPGAQLVRMCIHHHNRLFRRMVPSFLYNQVGEGDKLKFKAMPKDHLISKMTDPNYTQGEDDTFIDLILLTHSYFISSSTLLHTLVEKYKSYNTHPEVASRNWASMVRVSILRIVEKWVREQESTLQQDPVSIRILKEFTKPLPCLGGSLCSLIAEEEAVIVRVRRATNRMRTSKPAPLRTLSFASLPLPGSPRDSLLSSTHSSDTLLDPQIPEGFKESLMSQSKALEDDDPHDVSGGSVSDGGIDDSVGEGGNGDPLLVSHLHIHEPSTTYNTPDDDEDDAFLKMDARLIANQLTLMAHELFVAISPFEFLHNRFKTPNTSPNYSAMVASFNQTAFWVACEVLKFPKPQQRARVLSHFVRICKYCQRLGNFHSLFAIVGGLNKTAVSRLGKSWDRVSRKYRTILSSYKKLCTPGSNYHKYRHQVNTARLPAVPYLGVMVNDLIALEEYPNIILKGTISLVNIDKFRAIHKLLTEDLLKFQGVAYPDNLEIDPSMKHFLTGRAKESTDADEDALFADSQKYEPSKK